MKPNKHHGKKAREYHEKLFNPFLGLHWSRWQIEKMKNQRVKLILNKIPEFRDWA